MGPWGPGSWRLVDCRDLRTRFRNVTISVGASTTRNCFRPSTSLAVVLGTVGQGSWRLADCRDLRTRFRNITMI